MSYSEALTTTVYAPPEYFVEMAEGRVTGVQVTVHSYGKRVFSSVYRKDCTLRIGTDPACEICLPANSVDLKPRMAELAIYSDLRLTALDPVTDRCVMDLDGKFIPANYGLREFTDFRVYLGSHSHTMSVTFLRDGHGYPLDRI